MLWASYKLITSSNITSLKCRQAEPSLVQIGGTVSRQLMTTCACANLSNKCSSQFLSTSPFKQVFLFFSFQANTSNEEPTATDVQLRATKKTIKMKSSSGKWCMQFCWILWGSKFQTCFVVWYENSLSKSGYQIFDLNTRVEFVQSPYLHDLLYN